MYYLTITAYKAEIQRRNLSTINVLPLQKTPTKGRETDQLDVMRVVTKGREMRIRGPLCLRTCCNLTDDQAGGIVPYGPFLL